MKRLFFVLILILTVNVVTEAQKLDEFPTLNITDWIKGKPGDIGKWGDGKVYVIDLWGTWCLPCIKNIPELTNLQKKYGKQGLVVVGYSWEEATKLKKFVQDMGDKMQYVLVNDSEEKTLKYLAEEKEAVEGFPYAFVIDRKGRVVWQGAPQDGLEDVLGKLFSQK
ncbi:MAG TPA: TlpA disulfide reductase family protein [Bacteroidota bacterium]